MLLSDYLKSLGNKENVSKFALKCSTTPGQLNQVARGYRRAGEYLCINIDRESGGAVRCEDLRPDVDWGYLRGTSAEQDKAA